MTELYGTPRTIVVRTSAKTVRARARRVVVVRAPAPPPAVVVARTVVVRGVGVQGRPGADGGSSGTYYVHTQSTPAATWIIAHNIGRPVQVTLFDAGGSIFYGDVTESGANTATATFSTPVAGSAYLS